jgi:serine/threonine-protein kinase
VKLAEIDAATWEELNRLLDVGLDLPADQRPGWLAGLGPEHAPLVPRLAALLERLPRTGDGPLTLPRLGDLAPETSGPGRGAALAPGDEVGPYRLLDVIGEGGMGTVWRVERTDGLVRRHVALKLPHGPARGSGLAERMAREREILAGLAHPGIARLYDAGMAGGQPYLALELVEGVPIDRFAREGGLGLEARLRLFVQVARAAAHAHGRLVVHRDLKPGNVLVTADGHPKLLDFGIAKLLEDDRAEETALTRLGGRALTLAYASPEQVAGQPTGVPSDVYSLGVLLFELVTGSRPYRAGRGSRLEMERAVVEDPPLRASEAATDPGLRRALRGDLDAVLGRALRKAPEERYPTADAFADDVERHLAGRPVRARPDRLGYRARKFVRRNWLAVGAGGAVLVALVLGAGLATWQAGVARAEQRRAEEVKDFIASIFRDADPYHLGKPLSAAGLLEQARSRIDSTLGGPEVRVELKVILGRSLLDLQSVEVADQVVREAVEEGRRALGADHPQTLKARVLRNEILRIRGESDELRAGLDELIAALRAAGPPLFDELVQSIRHRAGLAIGVRPAEAVAYAEEALALARSRGGDLDPLAAQSAILLSLAHGYGGDPPAAAQAGELALRLASASHADPRHPIVMDARGTLARARALTGDHQGSAALQAELVRDTEAVLGPRHRMVGIWLAGLSMEQTQLGELTEALDSARRSAEILGDFDPSANDFVRAAHLRGRALALLALRRDAEALPDLTHVADAFRAGMGAANERTLQALVQRSLALGRLGRFDEAEAGLAAPLGASSHAAMFDPVHVRGIVARLAGRREEALRLQREALARAEEGEGPRRDWDRMVALKELGILEVEGGDHGEAAGHLEEALALFGRLQRRATPERAEALVALGRARWKLAGPLAALPLLEEAEAFWRELQAGNRWSGEAALWLGRCLAALDRAGSRAVLARARAALARSPLPGDSRLAALALP